MNVAINQEDCSAPWGDAPCVDKQNRRGQLLLFPRILFGDGLGENPFPPGKCDAKVVVKFGCGRVSPVENGSDHRPAQFAKKELRSPAQATREFAGIPLRQSPPVQSICNLGNALFRLRTKGGKGRANRGKKERKTRNTKTNGTLLVATFS